MKSTRYPSCLVLLMALILAGSAGSARAGNANIPRIDITMPAADFDAVNTATSTVKVKKTCTVSMRYPGDSTDRFSVKCEIRNHGKGAVHGRIKRSYRLKFRSTIDVRRLNYPVFERAPLHKISKVGFDNIVLRGGGNDSVDPQINKELGQLPYTHITDEWGRATQIEMSGFGNHGTFANLYVNGQFWGLYNMTERADRAWGEMHFGGVKDDWVSDRDQEGNLARFTSAMSVFRTAKSRSISQIREYIDPESFADYIMAGMYAGAFDWSESNHWTVTRKTPAGKTYWTVWDAEWWFRGYPAVLGDGPRTNWMDLTWCKKWASWASDTPPYHFQAWLGLIQNAEFKQIFSDRARMHLTTTGGALTDAKALARWDTLASFIKNDIQADINRWRPDVPWDQAKIRSRLPGRAAAAFAAFEDAGYIVAPGGIPAAPSSLAAAATSSTKITLTWQDNSSNETAFKIERSSSGSSGWVQIATTGANQTTYADSGLAAASTYYYRVRASNAAGNSAYSAVAGASTSETVPAVPSSLAAAADSSTKITLTWQDNSSNETAFKIERSSSGSSGWVQIATTGANQTTYADSGLATASTYYYRVRAGNAAGNSPYSAIADATTPADLQPPAAPGNLTATAVSATQIGLTWSDNSSDETLFKIDRRKSGMDTWVRIAEPAANTTVASDSGLDPETKYYYQIKAYNAAGNSPYSAIADATTPAAAQPPAAPSDLAATAGSSTRIDLTWSDNSSDETRFKIDRRQSGTDLWVRIAEPAADSTAHSDAGLAAETKYYYKIKAYNALGNSAYSAVAAATTPAGDDGVKIAKGATWRYRKGTTEASKPLDAWRLAAFDDSAWSASPAPFGYGDGPYGTTLADMRYTYSCVFLRSAFSIQNPASVAELDLWAQFDDAFIMWINGQEVARVNMDGVPGSPVARDALAASNMGPVEWTATLTSSALPALHDGENVLTVQVFNRSLDSSDLTFDAQLSIVNSQLSIDADADQDAMPDAWEAAHLADLADPSDRSASADPDDDGLSNLEEFIAGTDPVSGADCFAVDVALVNGKIVISFTAAAASGAGYEGYRRHYALECQNGTSGGHWEPVAGYADILGQDQTVTYTNAAPGAGACYRARVWLETD